jgi:hypothetical protein
VKKSGKTVVEFFFGENVVGYFEDSAPSTSGEFPYMPYRGLGHFQLVQALKTSGPQLCHTLADGQKLFFTAVRIPRQGVIETSQSTSD